MYEADVLSILPELLPRLWAFALRLSRNQRDAEELVQHACLHALERKHQLKPNISPLNRMFSLVHSVWLDKLRTRSVRGRTGIQSSDSFLETAAAPAARRPDADVINRQVLKAVDQLPHAQRTLLLLIVVEGLSYQEAAEILNMPIDTIMTGLFRARLTIGAKFIGAVTLEC
jgi:RNA polymerase sigma-70 factor (ECF subfamily)